MVCGICGRVGYVFREYIGSWPVRLCISLADHGS